MRQLPDSPELTEDAIYRLIDSVGPGMASVIGDGLYYLGFKDDRAPMPTFGSRDRDKLIKIGRAIREALAINWCGGPEIHEPHYDEHGNCIGVKHD